MRSLLITNAIGYVLGKLLGRRRTADGRCRTCRAYRRPQMTAALASTLRLPEDVATKPAPTYRRTGANRDGGRITTNMDISE
jgi:hypothetical protein